MPLPEIAIMRAVVAYAFREESARRAAEREGFAPVTVRRWLSAACHLGYHGRGERVGEIAVAHAAMFAREFRTDQGRSQC